MTMLERPLVAYTAWLCRTFGIAPAPVNRTSERNNAPFSPRPEGALGYYY